METPKIYVGTYAKHNDGNLYGKWLDLTDYTSKEDFYAACAELHSDEQDAEFMFQDHENILECFIGESWLSDKFFAYMEAVTNLDNEDAFTAFISNYGFDMDSEDVSDIINKFEDSFQGWYNSELDYAYEIADQCLEIPENIASYFDYDKYASDLFLDGYTYIDGYVFNDNF